MELEDDQSRTKYELAHVEAQYHELYAEYARSIARVSELKLSVEDRKKELEKVEAVHIAKLKELQTECAATKRRLKAAEVSTVAQGRRSALMVRNRRRKMR
jgi:CHASE3 domain sensor protein